MLCLPGVAIFKSYIVYERWLPFVRREYPFNQFVINSLHYVILKHKKVPDQATGARVR